MLALTVEIQLVQWKRGWQLEKIHSQSERSAEAGMPTFQSSDRSMLGSVPGHSWLNARPGGAHSKAHLSSSQLWSMEPLGSSFIVQYGKATKQTNRCRWLMTIGHSVEGWRKVVKGFTHCPSYLIVGHELSVYVKLTVIFSCFYLICRNSVQIIFWTWFLRWQTPVPLR